MSKYNSRSGTSFNERLVTFANISQIGSFIIQVAGIVFSVFIAGVLSVQEIPVSIPLVNITLGKTFQSVLLISSLFGLMQIYRNYWVKYEYDKRLNRTYWKFVFHEIPVRFPLLLMPLILVIGSLLCIATDTVKVFTVIVTAGIIFFGIVSYLESNEDE